MRIEKLSSSHDLSAFDCGKESLNAWLRRFALANQLSDSAQTYVGVQEGMVKGYYSLTVASVAPDEAPARISKGLARHPIGVVLLARLAADKSEQGHGIGGGLLKDALSRALSAAETVGVRAVLVNAIDAQARGFYEHFGFQRSPVDEFELMLLMKDIRVLLGTGRGG